MRLHGIHHITAITGNATRNVDFYARSLGLRFVKKTVNHDAPDVYHLYYGDERGTPGTILTFFEFPGAAPGRAGAGQVHRISWRVASEEGLEFWAGRLADEGIDAERDKTTLRFADPEGLGLELVVDRSAGESSAAWAPDVPAEHALRGFAGVRAYAEDPGRSDALLAQTLAFEPSHGAYRSDDATYAYDPAPGGRSGMGAGSVHHIAWVSEAADHEAWREPIAARGLHPTEVIDRIYFRSIYFREPSGVLFELATPDPGFAADEDPDHLGSSLVLPERYEHMRDAIERRLTPVSNPRVAAPGGSA